MQLLKVQKIKTSSACPEDPVKRAGRLLQSCIRSQPGPHVLARGSRPWRGHQARPARMEQLSRKNLTADCAVHLRTWGRRWYHLFSLIMVVSFCLTGAAQCDKSHVDLSPWQWFEVMPWLKARSTGEQQSMIKAFSLGARRSARYPILFHHLFKAAVLFFWQLVIPVSNTFHGSQFLTR